MTTKDYLRKQVLQNLGYPLESAMSSIAEKLASRRMTVPANVGLNTTKMALGGTLGSGLQELQRKR